MGLTAVVAVKAGILASVIAIVAATAAAVHCAWFLAGLAGHVWGVIIKAANRLPKVGFCAPESTQATYGLPIKSKHLS